MIKLTISKMVDNPYYEEQMEKINQRCAGYSGGFNDSRIEYPQKKVEETIFISEITEEQFEAIRKEVIKVL